MGGSGRHHHHHRHPQLVVGLGGVAVLLLTVLVKDEHGWILWLHPERRAQLQWV